MLEVIDRSVDSINCRSAWREARVCEVSLFISYVLRKAEPCKRKNSESGSWCNEAKANDTNCTIEAITSGHTWTSQSSLIVLYTVGFPWCASCHNSQPFLRIFKLTTVFLHHSLHSSYAKSRGHYFFVLLILVNGWCPPRGQGLQAKRVPAIQQCYDSTGFNTTGTSEFVLQDYEKQEYIIINV